MANEKKVLIRVENLKQYFPVKKASFKQKEQLFVRANDDITLDIYQGETLGLVGESGCGKSTLGRTLLQLYNQTDGRTMYYGEDIDEVAPEYVLDILKNLSAKRKEVQAKQKKEIEFAKTYDKMTDGEEKRVALEEKQMLEKDARNSLLDITQLIGGFIVADDLAPISGILVKEYNASIELRILKDKLNEDMIELQAAMGLLQEKGKTEEQINEELKQQLKKVQDQEKAIAKSEDTLGKLHEDVEKMKDKYRNHEEFSKYEALLDKGINLTRLKVEEMRRLRENLQLIFQDPYSSLNPRLTVGQIISEGLFAHKKFAKNDPLINDHIIETMEQCGLAPYFIHRYPHQFSGGQRQRIGIARSVALKPKFIVCDEAVSALDVSIQSQIINLLLDLKEEENLTYLFISHDLSVIKYISDRVAVMYLGNVVELATTPELYSRPMHPYTEALLSAIPTTDPNTRQETIILEGDIPSPITPPPGCKFHTRCRYATDICKVVVPEWEEAKPGHFVACHHKLNQD